MKDFDHPNVIKLLGTGCGSSLSSWDLGWGTGPGSARVPQRTTVPLPMGLCNPPVFCRRVHRAELPAGPQAHGDPPVHEIRRPAQLPAPLAAGDGPAGNDRGKQSALCQPLLGTNLRLLLEDVRGPGCGPASCFGGIQLHKTPWESRLALTSPVIPAPPRTASPPASASWSLGLLQHAFLLPRSPKRDAASRCGHTRACAV